MISLCQSVDEHLRAGFGGLWVCSQEQTVAAAEIKRAVEELPDGGRFLSWDLDRGLVTPDGKADRNMDPVTLIRALPSQKEPNVGSRVVLLAHNLHRLMHVPELVQCLLNAIAAGKVGGWHVIVLAPSAEGIPPELQRLFVVLEHALPDRAALADVIRGVATEEGDLPEEIADRVFEAAAGLTREEAENAAALSLVRESRIAPEALWELKADAIRKTGCLSLHKGGGKFADLGGLNALKAFCLAALGRRERKSPARGVMLLGTPGSGKSAFAKALGAETGRPTVTLDVGAAFGSLVGETEQQIRRALEIVDAMAPCILFVDEVEKALSGAADGGGDSGVSKRMFGTLLTWLSDHTTDVFVICTANDISALPPEFTRAERFDAVYFLDLPSREQKDAIWGIHRARYGIDPADANPQDTDWTGAEILSCCRLADMLGVPLAKAARNVVPVARSSAERIEKLRQWAKDRTLPADESVETTTVPEAGPTAGGRRIHRGPKN